MMGGIAPLPPPVRDHVPLAIDLMSHQGEMATAFTVCANVNLKLSDEALFDTVQDATLYAAALSAKHGAPIVPHGAAASYLGELLS